MFYITRRTYFLSEITLTIKRIWKSKSNSKKKQKTWREIQYIDIENLGDRFHRATQSRRSFLHHRIQFISWWIFIYSIPSRSAYICLTEIMCNLYSFYSIFNSKVDKFAYTLHTRVHTQMNLAPVWMNTPIHVYSTPEIALLIFPFPIVLHRTEIHGVCDVVRVAFFRLSYVAGRRLAFPSTYTGGALSYIICTHLYSERMCVCGCVWQRTRETKSSHMYGTCELHTCSLGTQAAHTSALRGRTQCHHWNNAHVFSSFFFCF